jgi:cysteine-rich repeat protein
MCGNGIVDDPEECDDANSNPDDGCVSCQIATGYSCSGKPSRCTDIDECREGGEATCDAYAKCTNKPGGYDCSCKPGYDGDGYSCTDIDECRPNGEASCDPHASCDGANPPGSYTCECNDGYSGNGMSCAEIDECSLGTDTCADSPKGQCFNDVAGSYSCKCTLPYFGDGRTCTCRTKSVNNVIATGNFDDDAPGIVDGDTTTSAWTGSYPNIQFDESDADGCPDSGSMRLGTPNDGTYSGTTICVPTSIDTDYHFGFRYKREADGVVGCMVVGYSNASCSSGATGAIGSNNPSTAVVDDPGWVSTDDVIIHTGASDVSVLIICQTTTNVTDKSWINVWLDQVYFNTTEVGYGPTP